MAVYMAVYRYVSSQLPLAARRAKLLARYGFDCTCTRCAAEAAEEQSESDAATDAHGAMEPVAKRMKQGGK